MSKLSSSVAGATLLVATSLAIAGDKFEPQVYTKDSPEIQALCKSMNQRTGILLDGQELCEVSTDKGKTWTTMTAILGTGMILAGAAGGILYRRRKKESTTDEDLDEAPVHSHQPETPESSIVDTQSINLIPMDSDTMNSLDTRTAEEIQKPEENTPINITLIDDLLDTPIPIKNHDGNTKIEFVGKNFSGEIHGTVKLAQGTSIGGKKTMQDYVNSQILHDGKVVMIVLDGVSQGTGDTEGFVKKIGDSLIEYSLQDVRDGKVTELNTYGETGTTAGKVIIENNMLSSEKYGDIGILIFNKYWDIQYKNISGGFIPDSWIGSEELINTNEVESIRSTIEEYGFRGNIDSTVPEYIHTKGDFMKHFGYYTKQLSKDGKIEDEIDVNEQYLLDGDTVVVGTDGVFDNISIEELVSILQGEKSALEGTQKLLSTLDNRKSDDKGINGPYKEDNIGFAIYHHAPNEKNNQNSIPDSELSFEESERLYDTYFAYEGNDKKYEDFIKESPNVKKYIHALHDILEKYGESKLKMICQEVRDYFTHNFNKHIPQGNTAIASQDGWIYWDIAKQYHLFQFPQESDVNLYSLANPMEEQGILVDIAIRHLGWELSRQYIDHPVFSKESIKDLLEKYPKNKYLENPSHVYTKIGYDAINIAPQIRNN